MIAIGSCGHNCDDERIYHKQINTLVSNGYKIKYFTKTLYTSSIIIFFTV